MLILIRECVCEMDMNTLEHEVALRRALLWSYPSL